MPQALSFAAAFTAPGAALYKLALLGSSTGAPDLASTLARGAAKSHEEHSRC